MRGRLLLALVGAALVVTGAAATDGGAGTRVVYVAPNGSDKGLCTQAAPCRTFDRGYRVAKPGETILLAGGTYPSQLVRVDPTKVRASRNVVFTPARGATVSVAGELQMYGSHATFRGSPAPYDFKVRKLESVGTRGPTTSNHVEFDNLSGETFSIGPNYDITIDGGDFGPSIACHARGSKLFDPSTWCPAGSPYATTGNDGAAGPYENAIGPDGNIRNQWPHDIVLDGVTIHDQNSLDLDKLHQGGLFIISGYDITIENSKFLRNVVYDVQVQDFTNPDCCGMTFGPAHDVVIQNNWFGQDVLGLNDPGGPALGDNQPELQLDPRGGKCWTNWLIRFNSFFHGPALGFDADPCFSNVRVIGNIGEHPGLQCFYGAAGLTWAYNAWVNGQCGPTDVALTALPYVDPTIGQENYDLTGGPAVGLVTPTGGDYALSADIQGRPRPDGGADAGADQP
jgi:hypothetical protein